VIVAGKQPAPQWLAMEEAATHAMRALASGNGLARKTLAASLMS
jgi:hypothetical protein